MSAGFIAILVIVAVFIIGVTIWATNSAYSRKPDTIDPDPLQQQTSDEAKKE
ncbi:hypothetical protein ACAF76_002060 [Brevibacillus sp. TJ4]|uniref:hypothetical protein n=1 Tax=Brevibacillus sp. TJ4 TaxID=3234853 RepID=UPI0037CDD885